MAQAQTTLTVAATAQLQRILAGDPSPKKLEAALRHLAKWRSALVSNTLVAKSGDTVLWGPFKGMSYPIRAAEGSHSARLLGAYEASLAPIIEDIVARDYKLVIDVGSAEGYYAVGLARRMPDARIMARDANPLAQDLCLALAEANDVAHRVEIGGIVDYAAFDLCKAQKTLVICDIEGAEGDLLDPIQAAGLLEADILVEAHDCLRPGLSDLIRSRFEATHTVTLIGRKLADEALPDWMETLSDMDRLIALWEWRNGPTPWLWMERKA